MNTGGSSSAIKGGVRLEGVQHRAEYSIQLDDMHGGSNAY